MGSKGGLLRCPPTFAKWHQTLLENKHNWKMKSFHEGTSAADQRRAIKTVQTNARTETQHGMKACVTALRLFLSIAFMTVQP